MAPLPTLTELHQFVEVANTKSFSGAAKHLQLSAASVSLAIKRLEKTLGVKLFERSTRSVRLTEEGVAFYTTSIETLSVLSKGVDALHDRLQQPHGKVTISAPSDLARTLLSTWLREFLLQYPHIELELLVSDTLTDFTSRSVDMAIRYGIPQDSRLIARPLQQCKRLLCASPSYLSRFGCPMAPSELPDHRCLVYKLKGQLDNQWLFYRQQQVHKVTVSPYLATDDSGLAREWALAGCGLIYKSSLDVSQDIEMGKLIPLLSEYQGSESPLYLTYPGADNQPNRLRLLHQFLRGKFAHTHAPK